MCSSEPRLRATENPSEWRFTWEAQSHVPILRLYLFTTRNIKPAASIAPTFASTPRLRAVSAHYFTKRLSAAGEVNFYCRSCTAKLTRHESVVDLELPVNQKIFLNGFSLRDAFMARPSYLSKDIEWIEFFVPNAHVFLVHILAIMIVYLWMGGVRLYKFYISTSLPANGAYDLFRNYTFERMFTSQLLESAKDELSFRTVVRDLHNKMSFPTNCSLESNAWSYAGIFCLHALEPASPRLMCIL
nr:uncharacterized protein LOC109167581 [Ipomoea batatas]